MKKLIILKNGGGELANQLWNYTSIYAYGIEIGARVQNPSFFEYHASFQFLPQEHLLTRVCTILFLRPKRRSHPLNRIGRLIYKSISSIIGILNKDHLISSENSTNSITYVPPTASIPQTFDGYNTIYFNGWLFRNPEGLDRHRTALIEAFRPRKHITEKVHTIVKQLRRTYRHIIGVHIRQGDYATFKGGRYLIDQKRMSEIMREYIHKHDLTPAEVGFIITSDGSIDINQFTGLNITVSTADAVTDLFTLSSTDAIIGSNSSFGHFAAWYGNIPHIVATKEPIEWSYYSRQNTYFRNKYCTLAQL